MQVPSKFVKIILVLRLIYEKFKLFQKNKYVKHKFKQCVTLNVMFHTFFEHKNSRADFIIKKNRYNSFIHK